MTHQRQTPRPTPRADTGGKRIRFAALASSAAALSLLLAGCGGEDEAPKPVANNEPVELDRAPAPPPVTPIDQLMSQHGIDQRIQLLESNAPGTDAERLAVLKFFHAMATQQSGEFQQMLSNEDRMEFSAMMQNDQVSDMIAEIVEIRLQCGSSPDFKPAVVAIIETYDGWQPQLWTYSVPANSMGGLPPVFDSAPTPLSVMTKLSGSGQVNQWYQLLDEELVIADLPEQDAQSMKVDLRDEVGEVRSSGSGTPSGPGGTPGRVKPKNDKKFDAPKMPGFGN